MEQGNPFVTNLYIPVRLLPREYPGHKDAGMGSKPRKKLAEVFMEGSFLLNILLHTPIRTSAKICLANCTTPRLRAYTFLFACFHGYPRHRETGKGNNPRQTVN